MGKLINGIHGPIQGKVGTVVGVTWNGLPYLRSKPGKRGARRTDNERQNQSNFSKLHYWLKPVIDYVREGFKGYAERVHGFNAAKSYNLKHAFVGEGSGNPGYARNKVLDPSFMQLSYGDLPLPLNPGVTKTDEYTLQFTWDKTYLTGTDPNDQAMLLAYDPQKKIFRRILTGQFRSTGTDTLALEQIPGCNYHVYLAFTAHDRGRQSHSVYLGMIST